jgi:hypothetical protein
MDHRSALTTLALAFCCLLGACGEACDRECSPGPDSKVLGQVLWDTEAPDQAKALVPFFLDPPAAAKSAPPVRWDEESYPRLTDKDDWNRVKVEDDGFDIWFEIECGLDSDKVWNVSTPRLGWVLHGHHFHPGAADPSDFWRTISSGPGKGETTVRERRVFAIDFARSNARWFSVSIEVSDHPREKKTVGDMLAALEKHYPTYARLCKDIEAHLYEK